MSDSPEKRTHPRVQVTMTARARIGNRFVRDAVVDLSQGGLYLKTREPAREGTEVRVALALPFPEGPRFCTLVGAVARVDHDARGTRGLGVSFVSGAIAADDLQWLSGFVDHSRLA